LSTVAALIEIDPDDPTDAEDFAVLRGLLARRVDLSSKSASSRPGSMSRGQASRPACCARSVIRVQHGEADGHTVHVSETDEVDGTAVARFVAMGAYGEVMLRFQLLEMSYWSILAARKRRGMSLGQHIAKLTEWDRQTGERLIKALGLPDDLRDEAMTAVNTRNLLAHRFLRERAVFFSDPQASYEAARVLAEVEVKIDEFEERLDAYMRELGIEGLDESEIEALGLAESPDFGTWSALFGKGE
jgi:hypothetical protein